MSGTAPCPMCRATFCMLDVLPLKPQNTHILEAVQECGEDEEGQSESERCIALCSDYSENVHVTDVQVC